MPSLKEVRNRISSVTSTQQITKAMKMVAAAKLRRAQDNITQMRPYAQKLNAIIENVSAATSGDSGSVFTQQRGDEKVLLVVFSSDRGLCGGFNTYIFRATNHLISTVYASQNAAGNLSLMTIGRKATEYYAKRFSNIITDYSNAVDKQDFGIIKAAADYVMDGFAAGQFDKVVVIYNHFKNVVTQIVQEEQVLPLMPAVAKPNASEVGYIFQPDADFIVNDLIPKSVRIQLFKALLDSNASEQGARMSAMDKATENAGELLKTLKLEYNRSRQAAITKEILEIVGGAEALAAQ